ncbi:MAG: hypothetical protein NNA22_08505 [Nitrospira sp.]|nr:hypothetical protein [Nitrospira sp.]
MEVEHEQADALQAGGFDADGSHRSHGSRLWWAGRHQDGIRGTVVAIERTSPEYVVRDAKGRERRLWTNKHTRKDPVKLGDEVRVFVAKDGYAASIMKLDGR